MSYDHRINGIVSKPLPQDQQISEQIQNANPQESIRRHPIPPGIEKEKIELAQKNFSTIKTGHNPVYSPMPFNIQNPYILKQLQAINQLSSPRTNYLSKVASQNIFNGESI